MSRPPRILLNAATVVSLAVVASQGCGTRGPAIPAGEPNEVAPAVSMPDVDAAMFDAVFRHLLQRADPGVTTFVALGVPSGNGFADPPPELLRRLADLPLRIRPASAARFPRRGEMAGPNQLRGVEDPATGRRSRVYWVQITAWETPTRVHVESGEFAGPLASISRGEVYELRDGRWTHADSDGMAGRS